MSARPPTLVRHLGLGALGIALLASPALVSAPAQAMPTPGPGVECVVPTSPARVPGPRRIPDTPKITAAMQERIEQQTRAAAPGAALGVAPGSLVARAAALPTYRVKVHIHLIRGSHKKDRTVSKKGARKKILRTLRVAYAGGQSAASAPMGIDFRLKRITVTRNDDWYHARMNSRADKQMKRKLHRGTARTLNIYVNKVRPPGGYSGLLLGYARFPWQYRHNKWRDGVTVNVRGLPIRGAKAGYNKGDTVVHETGHWLGLLHTFQGGCSTINDGVADTPAEATASFFCEVGRDTCPDLGTDPVHNFMDYSYDTCMYLFTPGQRVRVAQQFAAWRLGR